MYLRVHRACMPNNFERPTGCIKNAILRRRRVVCSDFIAIVSFLPAAAIEV